MDTVCALGHVEFDVDERRGLGRRPMNTGGSSTRSNIGGINDKVTHLAVEDICRNPVQVLGEVRVTVDQAEAREVRSRLQDRTVGRVTNQLGEVRGLKSFRDLVRSRREVNNGRRRGA